MLKTCYERLFICLCLMFSLTIYAQSNQQNVLDSFSAKLITSIRSHGKPQAFLTTDKSIFKAGESIWFRAFLLNAISQKITSKTKYLIVDLVNEKDSVISLVLLDASSQQLNNRIILPGNVSPGYYWIRAYTKQMAEEDSNNCFIKPIYILSPNGRHVPKLSSPTIATIINDRPSIKFYPEGGSIITGANCIVSFYIEDETGKPIQTEGVIKDNRDTIVTSFTSDKWGLGKFNVLPSSHRKYKAYFKWKDKEQNYSLPAFNFYAGQIAVTKPVDENIALRVLLEDSIYRNDLTTYIIGISKDSLCFAGIGRGQYELNVPKQKFPEGIATFYLFDDNLKCLSERSIYIQENNVIVKTSVDKNIYGKRDKTTLTVSVTDATNKPVASLLSVAVVDSAFSNTDGCTIPDFNNRASINNMALIHSECFTKEDIDLMMLIRNNTYNAISKNSKKSLPVNDDSLLFINGKAFDEKNQPAANKVLSLISNGSKASFTADTTNNTGIFSFAVFDYMDSTQFMIEARGLNNKSMKVKIMRDAPLFPRFSTPASLKHYFTSEPLLAGKYLNAYLDTTFDGAGKKLTPVLVNGKREVNYNESKRVSSSSVILGPDQLDERTSVGNSILGVGGLHLLNGFLVINGLTSIGAPDAHSEPLLLIDGAEAANAGSADESRVIGTLNSINPKDIDFIEILKGSDGANYGERGGNGVILVNMLSSRKDKFGSNNLQTFYAKGISRPSTFPEINYDNKAIKSSENFDNRSAIFWDGSVLTGDSDHVNLVFFTSDIPTTYKVTISGITVHGDFIYKVLFFHSK